MAVRTVGIVGWLVAGLVCGCGEGGPGGDEPVTGEQELRLSSGAESPRGRRVLSDDEAAAFEEPESERNVVHSLELRDGAPSAPIRRSAAALVVQHDLEHARRAAVTRWDAVAAPPKIAPELLEVAEPEVDVIINYHSDLRVPRLPLGLAKDGRDAPANAERADRARELIAWVANKRAPAQQARARKLEARGARVSDRFWLFDGLAVTLPAGELGALAEDPEVASIEPADGGPLHAVDMVVGRNLLNSDPYFNAGLTGGWIGLLDSGVNQSHSLLAGRLTWVRDCVVGDLSNCSATSSSLVLNPNDFANHGTGTAGIMGGGSALGFNHRGVSGILMDSFRVGATTINNAAAVRGYQAALAGQDNVINLSGACSACNPAASAAFDAGAVIVASVGNLVGGHTGIHNPAAAPKVLGIGAVDSNKNRVSISATGPAAAMTKPDLMALGFGVNLADRDNVNGTRVDTGTSISSAYVSGAAGLMRRWMSGASTIEPAFVYAMLIAAGENRVNAPSNFEIGAGNLALPTNASIHWSKVSVAGSQTVDATVNLGAGTLVDVAIWWARTDTLINNYHLLLRRPDGTTCSSSQTHGGVWEKTSCSSTATGAWKVRIFGHFVTTPQDVYWAVIRR